MQVKSVKAGSGGGGVPWGRRAVTEEGPIYSQGCPVLTMLHKKMLGAYITAFLVGRLEIEFSFPPCDGFFQSECIFCRLNSNVFSYKIIG